MARRGLTTALQLIAAAALLAGPARADAPKNDSIALDSARSHATFGVKVMWLVPIHGRFGKVAGIVDVDRFRNFATVDARIDANAVEMSTKSYEDWVKSDEFFDVAHYPEIHFVSESFPLQRLRSGGQLSGTLTVRGVEQPETFKLQAADCDHPAYDCPIVVSGSIRRSAFGMHSRRGALSDKVDLHFEVYAIPSTERLSP
ncbi:MAG TPA: YceI family protein [Rhodanobacteraceae bacterium]|nr:YceI family protein [Rhodanobacteraceae bacterium]